MLRSIGGLMFFYGVGSIVLNFLHYEFTIMSWMNRMEEPVAWAIRIGLAVLGAVLWLAGKPKKQG